jgi:hypothetical protein
MDFLEELLDYRSKLPVTRPPARNVDTKMGRVNK